MSQRLLGTQPCIYGELQGCGGAIRIRSHLPEVFTMTLAISRIAVLGVALLPASVALAQNPLAETLQTLAETPAVSGYEGPLVALLKQRLDLLGGRERLSPQVDNLGNLRMELAA